MRNGRIRSKSGALPDTTSTLPSQVTSLMALRPIKHMTHAVDHEEKLHQNLISGPAALGVRTVSQSGEVRPTIKRFLTQVC